MSRNPRDTDTNHRQPLAKAETMTDATWFDEFTIELRLLAVPGDDIGDALASAREFLADSSVSAMHTFGNPKLYAAELKLPALPQRRVNGASLRAGLGLLGLLGFMHSALSFVQGEAVAVDLATLVVFVAVGILAVLLPTFLQALVRVRLRAWMIVVAALLGLGTAFGLSRLAGTTAVLFSVPAPAIVIGSALLVLVPAVWSQLRHSLRDDPIVEPGGNPEARPSISTRLFLGMVNWSMVAGSIVIWLFVLFVEPSASA